MMMVLKGEDLPCRSEWIVGLDLDLATVSCWGYLQDGSVDISPGNHLYYFNHLYCSRQISSLSLAHRLPPISVAKQYYSVCFSHAETSVLYVALSPTTACGWFYMNLVTGSIISVGLVAGSIISVRLLAGSVTSV